MQRCVPICSSLFLSLFTNITPNNYCLDFKFAIIIFGKCGLHIDIKRSKNHTLKLYMVSSYVIDKMMICKGYEKLYEKHQCIEQHSPIVT